MDFEPILLITQFQSIHILISIEIVILLTLLVLSAMISGTEIAFFSITKHQLEESKEKNKK